MNTREPSNGRPCLSPGCPLSAAPGDVYCEECGLAYVRHAWADEFENAEALADDPCFADGEVSVDELADSVRSAVASLRDFRDADGHRENAERDGDELARRRNMDEVWGCNECRGVQGVGGVCRRCNSTDLELLSATGGGLLVLCTWAVLAFIMVGVAVAVWRMLWL